MAMREVDLRERGDYIQSDRGVSSIAASAYSPEAANLSTGSATNSTNSGQTNEAQVLDLNGDIGYGTYDFAGVGSGSPTAASTGVEQVASATTNAQSNDSAYTIPYDMGVSNALTWDNTSSVSSTSSSPQQTAVNDVVNGILNGDADPYGQGIDSQMAELNTAYQGDAYGAQRAINQQLAAAGVSPTDVYASSEASVGTVTVMVRDPASADGKMIPAASTNVGPDYVPPATTPPTSDNNTATDTSNPAPTASNTDSGNTTTDVQTNSASTAAADSTVAANTTSTADSIADDSTAGSAIMADVSVSWDPNEAAYG